MPPKAVAKDPITQLPIKPVSRPGVSKPGVSKPSVSRPGVNKPVVSVKKDPVQDDAVLQDALLQDAMRQTHVTPAEISRVTELVRQALSPSEHPMEVEAALTYRATPAEFSTAIAAIVALPGASKPEFILQLDCSGGSKRWEFVGEDRIRAFLRRGASIGPQADRVLEKKRAADPVDLAEWPIRVNLKTEKPVLDSGRVVPQAAQVKMRLKRRVSVEFKDAGVRVDMTVVMESGNNEKLGGRRHQEIEVEAIPRPNMPSNPGNVPSVSSNPVKVAAALLAYAHAAYCAAKGTGAPLTKSQMARVLDAYAGLTNTPVSKFKFVGPAPVTLNRENIVPPKPGVVSIMEGYTVTDKADGDRRLLFVTGGTAYLLDNRGGVSVAFTDSPAELDGTLLDGELISRARLTGSPMRMFAAFDAYWKSNKNVSELPLLAKDPTAPQRVAVCKEVIGALHAKATPVDGIHAVAKKFLAVGGPDWGETVKAIYQECTRDAPYEVDGLIFTPAAVPAGAKSALEPSDLSGGKWPLAMKWKPPSHNSVDFLVRFKRDKRSGADIVKVAGEVRRKTCVLYSGYNASKYEPIDPLDYLTRGSQALPRRAFVAKVFAPPGMSDYETVSEVDVKLTDDGRVTCEDGDTIEDNSVVEFRWAQSGWLPMRVRHDKNERMAKTGLGGTLNEWGTAMGVWNSIQNPVTLKMVTGMEPVPAVSGDADVYYDHGDVKRDRTGLKSMADFHNLVVKAGLYHDYGVQKGALLELACGRGGDVSRWIANGFAMIVGIDMSNDNITNPDAKYGLYARWDSVMAPIARDARPHGIFITMDVGVRLFPPLDEMREASAKVGQAALTNVMFGIEASVPKALEPFNGVMTKGFDLVSCQFAMHYLFRNDESLDKFIANVARMTRPGGHFIATAFDGDSVASALAKGPVVGRAGGAVLWEISWSTDNKEPWKGETGRAIDVFVSTIGKAATEYLVSFKMFTERMKTAGMHLVKSEMFDEAYRRGQPGVNIEMSPVEKGLSFFYRSFVYKRG